MRIKQAGRLGVSRSSMRGVSDGQTARTSNQQPATPRFSRSGGHCQWPAESAASPEEGRFGAIPDYRAQPSNPHKINDLDRPQHSPIVSVAFCWNSSSDATTRHQRCSAPSTPRRIGTSASVPGFTPTRSRAASCTTPSGSRPAATTCENTPPVKSRPRHSRIRSPLAGPRPRDCVAPKGNTGGPRRQYSLAPKPANTHQ